MENKSKITHKTKRIVAMSLLIASAIAVIVAAAFFSDEKETAPVRETKQTYGKITDYRPEDVNRLAVTLCDGTTWTAERRDGSLYIIGENGESKYQVSQSFESTLLDAVCTIDYLDVLSEDFSQFKGNSEEFGLEPAAVTAEVTYSDGSEAEFSLGTSTGLEDNSVFMVVAGDNRLFSADRDKLTHLNRSAAMFRHVEQPVIHKSRINMVEIRRPGQEKLVLQMDAEITDADSKDRWVMKSPFDYPAEGTAIDSLLSTGETLRLGAYVGSIDEMNPEEREKYGVDNPRMVLTLHMDSGSIGNPDSQGQYTITDYDESAVTFALGESISDVMDYIAYNGDVYSINHFQINVFLQVKAEDLLSRYPVTVALDTLKSLRITDESGTDQYVISRQEATQDSDSTASVTKNGKEISYAAFEAEYDRLAMATVSGRLPEEWKASEPPRSVFSFTNMQNQIHTVELTKFDPLHDAVTVDGGTVFYIISTGFTFHIE